VKKIIPKEKLPEMIQPQVVPDKVPDPDPSQSDDDAGVEGGVEGGVPGGVPGGVVGGVVGGVIGGVIGGVPGGIVSDDQPIYLTGDVRPPELVTKVQPEYPEVARRARAEGKVILEIVVNRNGEVESAKVLKSHPLFDQAAIDAVKKWKYNPALQSGRPVKVYITVVVDFKLK
jgi:protein TonB